MVAERCRNVAALRNGSPIRSRTAVLPNKAQHMFTRFYPYRLPIYLVLNSGDRRHYLVKLRRRTDDHSGHSSVVAA